MKALEYVNEKLLSELYMREQKVYLNHEQAIAVSNILHEEVNYLVKEIVDPIITIRKEDLIKALEIARSEGVLEGSKMVSIV